MLEFRGESPCGWLATLPETELPLRGHLVADLAVCEIVREGDRYTAVVEVLTVEEG